MTTDYLALAYTGLIGALALVALSPTMPILWRAATCVPVGIVVVGIWLGVLSLIVEIGSNGVLICLPILLCVVIAACISRLGQRFIPVACRAVLAAVVTVSAIACLRAWKDLSFVLGDSLIQADAIQNVLAHGWTEKAGALLSSWSFLYLGYGLLTATAGHVVNSMSGHAATVSLTLAAIALLRTAWINEKQTWSRGLHVAGAAVVALLLGASCFYLYMTLYFVTSNFLLATLMGLCAACLVDNGLAGRSLEKWQEPMLSLLLLGVALARVEGILYFSIISLWLMAAYPEARSTAARAIVPACVGYALIFLVQAPYVFGGAAGMIAPLQLALFPVAAMAWLVFALVGARSDLGRHVHLLPYVAASVLLVAVMAMADRSQEFSQSLAAIRDNVFNAGLWGPLPMMAISLAPALALVCRNQAISMFAPILAIAVCMVLLLSLGRTPYYVDIGDSGHRILGSFIPVFIFGLLGAMIAAMSPRLDQRPSVGADRGDA